jgi:hypothetical protein
MTTKLTIEKGWSPVTVGGGTYITTMQEVNTALTSGEVAPVTPAIPATARLSGSRVLVFINIDNVGADVAADMFMEMSPDGNNWSSHEGTGTDYITLSNDIQPDVAGYKVFIADLTDFRSPYYRIGFNSAGLDLGTAILFQMGYTFLK